MNVLVTGAGGKLGRRLLPALVKAGHSVRALQFRTPIVCNGVEAVIGSVSDARAVRQALQDMDVVCHLATSKEDAGFFDTSIKGTFNLLEGSREAGIKQFILAGGDAALGIFFNPQPVPLDECAPLRAYPGYYAFSKVMEETMCRQYTLQYGLPVTFLRFSWIQDEDDLLCHMTFKEPDFGFPNWRNITEIPYPDGAGILLHPGGKPYKRHIVGVDDAVQSFLLALGNPAALGETFNIAAPAPFSYDVLAGYVARKLSLPLFEAVLPDYYDFSIDIGKARAVLGYRPRDDVFRIIDKAIEFRCSGDVRSSVRYGG
ncbi:MAG: NAD-dependent epimerase/dehydratase family protein [bacterium]|jgi:UDP-glucose 4-epimerase|nr:NAD(P)-dependent oxidoreductase [bacterium]MDD3804973.1 NAD(P)-dependent oxidoreductase [bacterium]